MCTSMQLTDLVDNLEMYWEKDNSLKGYFLNITEIKNGKQTLTQFKKRSDIFIKSFLDKLSNY